MKFTLPLSPPLSFPLYAGLTSLVSLIMYFAFTASPEWHSLLYFNREAIYSGELWRLITGHFIHADTNHLIWNLLGLVILGGLIEQQGAKQYWQALGVGIIAVNFLLLSPLCSLDYYCGLSGALNALLIVAVWQQWQIQKSPLLIVLMLGYILKNLVEIFFNTSLVSQLSWQAYPASHIAGLLGGIVFIGFTKAKERLKQCEISIMLL